jgi:DNA-binding NtrC family response regulator
VQGLTPEALACLEAHHWPGNVRELRNLIERAVILAEGNEIGLEHLPPEVTKRCVDVTEKPPSADGSEKLAGSLLELEQRLIAEAMERCGGDTHAAAKVLGISEADLLQRMRA